MSKNPLSLVALVLGAVLALPAGGVLAAKREDKGKRIPHQALPTTLLEQSRKDLRSADNGKIEEAIRSLAATEMVEAAGPLIEALSFGLPPAHTIAALKALTKLKNPAAAVVFILHAGNRNIDVRKTAVQGLASLDTDAATQVLRERLGDPDAEVRALAAQALADRKDQKSVDRMLALLTRDDVGVAVPFGQYAPLSMVAAVAELQGNISDAAVASCLGAFITRADTPEEVRFDLVGVLGRMPGVDATSALLEYVASLPNDENPPSKEAAQKLIEQRGEL